MAAEAIQYSPLQLSAGEIVMAVEKSGGVSGASVQENQGSGSSKSFVVSTASPTLKQGGGTLAGILNTLRLQNRETDAIDFDILSSLVEMQSQLEDADLSSLNKDQFVQDLKEKLTALESALGGNVPGIRKMNGSLDEALATSSDEAEESGSQNSFGGTTTADARRNIALAAMSSIGAQSAVAEILQATMKESSVMSDKTLGMIEATRVQQDQNWDDWVAQQKKQAKMHFWTKIGMIVATTIIVAAVAIVAGPVAAGVLAGLTALQMSGTTKKMFSGLDGHPALKVLAETAFVVAVAVASGGAAAGVSIASSAASSVALEAGVDGIMAAVRQLGVEGFVDAMSEVGDEVMQQAYEQGVNAAKNTAFLAGTQTIMTTDLIQMTAQGLTDLCFITHEQSERKKSVELGIQTVLTIALVVGMALGGMKMKPGAALSDFWMTASRVLGAAGLGVQLGTDGLTTYSSDQLFKIANNQYLNALFTANIQEAQTLNQTNMSWSKSTQEQLRNMLESMQSSLLSTLQHLCQPIVAAAEAVRKA